MDNAIKISVNYSEDSSLFVSYLNDVNDDIRNYCKILEIFDCSSAAEASNLLSLHWFEYEIFNNFPSLLFIRVKISTYIEDENLKSLKEIYCEEDRAINIALECESTNQLIINWKNKEEHYFQELKLMQDNILFNTKIQALEYVYWSLNNAELVKQMSSDNTNLAGLKNSRNYDILLYTVLNQQWNQIDDLLKLPFDINRNIPIKVDNKTTFVSVIDYVMGERKDEIILKMLKANSKFPKEISINNSKDKIHKFLKMCENMHMSIIVGDDESVKKILECNKDLRYFFNITNKSAVSKAIECERENIYKILADYNVTFAPDEEFNCKNNDFLERISEINSERSKFMPERHKMILLSRSVVGHSDLESGTRLKYIKELIDKVDEINEISQVLKIVAMNSNIKIHFDFTQKCVAYVNPGTPFGADGVYISKDNHLFIAAKELLCDNTKMFVNGVFAHENTHCALDLVFRNNRLPYSCDDEVKKIEYEIILDECRILCDQNFIIHNVFRYEEDSQGRELIVRVPHILAQYQDDSETLEHIQDIFKNLFDFWTNNVSPEIEAAVPVLEKLHNYSVEIKFSDLTTPLKAAIKHSWIYFQGEEVQFNQIIDNDKHYEGLTSNQIRDILNGQFLSVGNIQKSVNPFYVERKFISSAFNEKNCEFNKETKKYELTKRAKEWAINLDEIIAKVNESNLVLLSDHAGSGKSTLFEYLSHELKHKMPLYFSLYIDLKQHFSIYEKYNQEVIDISDGKIYLKDKTESFRYVTEQDKTEQREKLEQILSEILSPVDKLELSVFLSLLSSGRVILLLDGLDEVSPRYYEFFIKLIANIKKLTNNHLWLATRPLNASDLKSKFNQDIYNMLELDSEKISEFIKTFLKFYRVQEDKIEVFTSEIMQHIENLRFVDNPMVIRMLVVLKTEDKILPQSYFSLYEEIVKLKLKAMTKKGDEVLLTQEPYSRFAELRIRDVIRVYAIKLIAANDDKKEKIFDKLQIMKKWNDEKSEWSPEMIARSGFLTVENWNEKFERPNFVHRTFAEYFITEFIIDSIKKAIEEDEKVLNDEEFELRIKLAVSLVKPKRSDVNVMNKFIREHLSKSQALKFSERFYKYLERNSTKKLLTKWKDDYSDGICSFLMNFFKICQNDRKIIYALIWFENDRSMLFEYFLTNISCGADLVTCVKLFELFKATNLPDWHRLTGYGLNLTEEEVNLLTEYELDENLKTWNLFYQFFSFIAKVDYLPVEKFETFFHVYLYSFAKSLLLCEKIAEKLFEIGKKHFKGEKRENFAEIITSLGFLVLPYDEEFNLEEKLFLFFNKVEKHFSGDRKLIQTALCDAKNNMLRYAIVKNLKSIKKLYQKHFNSEEIGLLLVRSFYSRRSAFFKDNECELVQVYNKFCQEHYNFESFFQLALIYKGNDMELFSYFDTTKFSEHWFAYSGYKLKQSASIMSLSSALSEVKKVAEEKFPYLSGDDQRRSNDMKENYRKMLINSFTILSLINQSEIKTDHLKRFFENNLEQIYATAESYEILMKILMESLKLLRNEDFFAKIFRNILLERDNIARSSQKCKYLCKCHRVQRIYDDLKNLLTDNELKRLLNPTNMDDKKILYKILKSDKILNNSDKRYKEVVELARMLVKNGEIVRKHFNVNFANFENALKRFLERYKVVYNLGQYDEYFKIGNDEDSKLTHVCYVTFLIFLFVFHVKEISHEERETFVKDSFASILFNSLRYKTMMEITFETLIRNNFGSDKNKLISIVLNGLAKNNLFVPGLSNLIDVNCKSSINYFWEKIEEILKGDRKHMRSILLNSPGIHPLTVCICNGLNQLEKLYFKYCEPQEILRVFVKSLFSVSMHFEFEKFDKFFMKISLNDRKKFFEDRDDRNLSIFDILAEKRLNLIEEKNVFTIVDNIESFIKFLITIASRSQVSLIKLWLPDFFISIGIEEKFKLENLSKISWVNAKISAIDKVTTINVEQNGYEDSVEEILQNFLVQDACSEKLIHPLLIAINENLTNLIKISEHRENYIKIILKHIREIYYLKNLRLDNFKAFFKTLSGHINENFEFAPKVSDEVESSYEISKKRCNIFFLLLSFVEQNKISKSILEDFFTDKCWIIFPLAFQSTSLCKTIFKIFKREFQNDKEKVADWIKNGIDMTGFFNAKTLQNLKITTECKNNIEKFWEKVTKFLKLDRELFRKFLLADYKYHQPLTLAIYYQLTGLQKTYFEYCQMKEILKIFTKNMNSVAHFFDQENFKKFIEETIISDKEKKIEFIDFLNGYDLIHERSALQIIEVKIKKLSDEKSFSKQEKEKKLKEFKTLLENFAKELNVTDCGPKMFIFRSAPKKCFKGSQAGDAMIAYSFTDPDNF